MAIYELQGTVDKPGDTPVDKPPATEKEHLAYFRAEIEGYYAQMRTFPNLDPVEVFLLLSGFTARVSEMRSQACQSSSQRVKAFRTQEIDPFLEEADRQFKYHSRIAALREMEYRMDGRGQV